MRLAFGANLEQPTKACALLTLKLGGEMFPHLFERRLNTSRFPHLFGNFHIFSKDVPICST